MGLAGQFHFRPQGERAIPLDTDHPPEVERLTKLNGLGMPPATPQSRASHERVHPSAEPPEQVTGIPPVAAADPADCGEDTLGVGLDVHHSLVGEHGAPRPGRVSRHRARHAPAGLDRMLINLGFCPVDRLANSERVVRHQSLRGVVGDHHPVLQPLSQRSGDAVGHGSDEVDPERTQPRGQYRHWNDDAATKAKFLRHHPHQLLVGHHVSPSDLQRPADRLRHLQAPDQPVQDIADGHRLTLRRHPLGRDHDREPFDQVAEDLERGRAGADDHRRAEGRDWDAGRGKFLFHLPPGTEVFAQVGAHLAESAEIDDPRQAGRLGGPGKIPGEFPVAVGVCASGGDHRMHEVVGRLAARQGCRHGLGVTEIAGDHLDLRVIPPGTGVEFAGFPHQAANPIALGQEGRHEPTPDIPCRSGHADQPWGSERVGRKIHERFRAWERRP